MDGNCHRGNKLSYRTPLGESRAWSCRRGVGKGVLLQKNSVMWLALRFCARSSSICLIAFSKKNVPPVYYVLAGIPSGKHGRFTLRLYSVTYADGVWKANSKESDFNWLDPNKLVYIV